MSYRPITLGIQRPLGRKQAKKAGKGSEAPSSGALPNHEIPAELKAKILDRDQKTCRCCGFESEKYQDVMAVNSDPDDQRLDNLATACIFCQQCFQLEQVAEMRSGVLIWLPEITQPALHHIMRAIYVARITQGPMAESARNALDFLMGRREEAKQRIETDDPAILATVLKDYLEDAHYAQREKKLKGIRLLPLDRRIIKEGDLEFNQFPQILAYWRSKDGPFGGLLPNTWLDLYRQKLLPQDSQPQNEADNGDDTIAEAS